MTFPIGEPVTQVWYQALVNDVTNIQGYCVAIQNATANSGTVICTTVRSLAVACTQLQADITFVGDNSLLTSAVEAYFNAQPGWSGINVGSEFTTLSSLAGAILTALGQDYPVATGSPAYLLDTSFSSTTGLVYRTFSATQLSHTMTAIANFLAELTTS